MGPLLALDLNNAGLKMFVGGKGRFVACLVELELALVKVFTLSIPVCLDFIAKKVNVKSVFTQSEATLLQADRYGV